MKQISKYALLIVLLVLLYLLISGNLLSFSPFVILAQLAAVALSIWARRSFQPDQFSIHAEPQKEHLLAQGPYQFIRHPMYASALLLIWSGILAHFTLITLIVGLIATGAITVRVNIEEEYLRKSLPAYGAYAGKTKRLIPFII
ncbi:MAG: isoprenylcysteine carboxylmethyltransferase family protein [Anaerolineales bacterium]|nr:isoprenylcysteine carboxylmethyltransferase family protein [Anaerolineales bacterium]